MIEHSGNKVASKVTQSMWNARIIEQVRSALMIPHTEVYMATTPNSLWIWFRRKTCQQAMTQCHASYSIAQLDLIISSAHRGRMANRYFLLPWAILVYCLFYYEILLTQCPHNLVHNLSRKIQSNRAVHWRLIKGHIRAILLAC